MSFSIGKSNHKESLSICQFSKIMKGKNKYISPTCSITIRLPNQNPNQYDKNKITKYMTCHLISLGVNARRCLVSIVDMVTIWYRLVMSDNSAIKCWKLGISSNILSKYMIYKYTAVASATNCCLDKICLILSVRFGL